MGSLVHGFEELMFCWECCVALRLQSMRGQLWCLNCFAALGVVWGGGRTTEVVSVVILISTVKSIFTIIVYLPFAPPRFPSHTSHISLSFLPRTHHAEMLRNIKTRTTTPLQRRVFGFLYLGSSWVRYFGREGYIYSLWVDVMDEDELRVWRCEWMSRMERWLDLMSEDRLVLKG